MKVRAGIVGEFYVPLPVSNEDVLARTLRFWTFDYRLPLPKWDVQCPCCRAKLSDDLVQTRHWNFHKHGERTKSKHRYRCDVHMKCRVCGLAFTFGLVVPDDKWDQKLVAGIVHYRQAYEILRNQGVKI